MQSRAQTTSARRQGRHAVTPGFTLKALPLAVALCFGSVVRADAINPGIAGLPQGGVVAAGTVASAATGSKLTLTQTSARAVIDWQSFNISAGREVQFVQPGATSAVLNRVSANAGLSEIYGSLNANGMVLLMNPNGVLFGQGATINVGSLIVTSGTVNERRFMDATDGAIAITGASASVTNQGRITAQGAGLVALMAPSVSNQGSIVATGGAVMLGGTPAATISMNGGLYEFVAGAADGRTSVLNSGTIQADGGTVLLTAANASAIVDNVINMDGIIQARSVGTRAGAIVLEGGDAGSVQVTGRLDASGESGTTGGKITVTGKSVELAATARLDASGDAGGGTVLVGGNWQGKGPERNAQTTTVAAGATLTADAVSHGDGGKVVVWADGTTRFSGEISARGGAAGGDGGSVEVSGKQSLGYAGMVDTNAAQGRSGSLLLDPTYAVISNAAAGTVGNTETINAAALVNSLNGGDILVQADTRATVDAAVNASGNANAHNLAFNAPTADLNAAITLKSGATLSGTASTVNVNGPNARIQNGVDVAASGGTVNVATGTYAENVSITKALTLSGAGAGNAIIDPVSGNAITVSGAIGASATVLIDGFTFHAPGGAGVGVAGDTTLGQLTVQNSDFLNNGSYGFYVGGSPTTGSFGLANVSLINSTFEGNGPSNTTATSLGQGAINFNFYNGNATLRGLTITGDNEFVGIQMRGYYNASTLAVYDAGTVVFDNIAIGGSFLRPSGSYGTWNPNGPGDAIHLLEYGSVANVSFNNVVINPTVGHGMFLEGLTSTINIGNTRFGVPDGVIRGDTGAGLVPTRSYNIVSGQNDHNNVRTNVNATQTVFTGAGNGFDIEDRVAHTLDRAELGLVTWAAGNVYVTPASASIQRGIDAASAGNTVNVAAGSYTERVKVNKANLTLAGQAGAKVVVPDDPSFDGITIEANNATVSGFEISGPLSSPYYTYYTSATYPSGFPWSSISRGIVASRGATGFVITNNKIHDIRTGILIDGRDSGSGTVTGSVTGNTIENTKSGISVQYTDGTDGAGLTRITIAGNAEGPIGNEWGINLHLNGFLDGGTLYPNPHGSAPTLAWQQALLNLSASNGGWAVQDQGYASANRTQAMVATTTGPASTQGSRLTPFTSVQSGVDAVVTGGKVNVAAGSYADNVVLNNRYNLSFSGVTLQGLRLNAGAAGSGIGGQVTVTGASGIAINAPISLRADTTLTTTGSNITLGGDVQNAGSTPYALTLTAGAGSSRGNVSMTTGGSAGNPLGQLEIKSNRFDLAGTLWVKGYRIDALGDVALSNHTLNATQAGVTNTLAAVGNVTGSTTSQGSVEVVSSGDSSVNVAAQGHATVAAENISGTISGADVAATAQGAMDVVVTASNSASLIADTVAATVTAPTVAVDAGASANLALNSTQATVHADGAVQVSGNASTVSINAPSGSVNGNFGDVNNTGTGLFSVNGRPELNQTLSANAENNRVIPGGSAMAGSTALEAGPEIRLPLMAAMIGPGGVRVVRGSPAEAGAAIFERGQSVEIDLTPGHDRE